MDGRQACAEQHEGRGKQMACSFPHYGALAFRSGIEAPKLAVPAVAANRSLARGDASHSSVGYMYRFGLP